MMRSILRFLYISLFTAFLILMGSAMPTFALTAEFPDGIKKVIYPRGDTDCGSSGINSYNVFQVDYEIVTETGCTVESTSWKVLDGGLELPLSDYFTVLTGGSDMAAAAIGNCLMYNSAFVNGGTLAVSASKSKVTVWITGNYLSLMPPLKAEVEFDCAEPPPPAPEECEKKNWHCDRDVDGVGTYNPNVSRYVCDKPAPIPCEDKYKQNPRYLCYCMPAVSAVTPTFVTTKGDECEYNPKLTKPLDHPIICHDGDKDGFPSDTFTNLCDSEEDGNHDVFCDGTGNGGGYESETHLALLDCNDDDPGIGPKQEYVKDMDGDGWYQKVLSGKHCYPPEAGAVPKAGAKGEETAYCDTKPDGNIMKEYCEDSDGDGFANKSSCKYFCANIPPAYPVQYIEASAPAECEPADDQDADMTPDTVEWLVDCDGDQYYNEEVVEGGCEAPKSPCTEEEEKASAGDVRKGLNLNKRAAAGKTSPERRSPAGETSSDYLPRWMTTRIGTSSARTTGGKPRSTANLSWQNLSPFLVPSQPDDFLNAKKSSALLTAGTAVSKKITKYIRSDTPVGKTLIGKDCNDEEPLIAVEGETAFGFDDSDGDGLGDPAISKIITCDQPSQDLIAGESKKKWVAKPNDIFPQLAGPNASVFYEAMNDKLEYGFVVISKDPEPCQLQPEENKPFCRPEFGTVCMGSFLENKISCLTEEFMKKYCPAFHSAFWPFGDTKIISQAYIGDIQAKKAAELGLEEVSPVIEEMVKPWQEISAFPFGTKFAMIGKDEFDDIGILEFLPQMSFNDPALIGACMLGKSDTKAVPGGINWYILVSSGGVESEYAYIPVSEAGWADSPDEIIHYLMKFDYLDSPGKFDLGQYEALNPAHKIYHQPHDITPVETLAEKDFTDYFGKFLVIDQLSGEYGMDELSKWLNVRIPVKLPGSTDSGYCLYKGEEEAPCKEFSEFVITDWGGKIDLSNEVDTDQDGVMDNVEMFFPGLNEQEGQVAAESPYITPVIFNDDCLMLHVGHSDPADPAVASILASTGGEYLKPEEFFFWEAAKVRAKAMVEDVYNRAASVVEGLENVKTNLTQEQWSALIDNAIPVRLALFPNGSGLAKEFMKKPIYNPYGAFGINTNVIPPEIFIDYWYNRNHIFSNDKIVDKASAFINHLADTLIHEVLHSHIDVMNDTIDFEHVLIYAITGEYYGYGCGTEFN